MRSEVIRKLLLTVLMGFSSSSHAVVIGDEGIGTNIITGGGPYRVLGETTPQNSSWWEDGYILQAFAIHNYSLSSAYISGGGFGGCGSGMICQLTETGLETNPDTGALEALLVQGFMIKKQDNSNFTLNSLSVLPNGLDPHIEGSDLNDTQLYIGTTFDRYRPLAESMNSYSMGALYQPRLYRDFEFGNTYANVNELFIFTSTDTFWSSIELSDVAVSSVPLPSAMLLFLSGIGMLSLIRRVA